MKSNNMGDIEILEVAINSELLKWLRLYQLFDPNGKKIIALNIYQLCCVMFIVIAELIFVYGTFGYFVEMDDTITDIDLFLAIAVHLQNVICFSKIVIILYNADAVWDLFDIARMNFLISKLCGQNIHILSERRHRSVQFTNLYFLITTMVVSLWLMCPIVLNAFTISEIKNTQRLQNIFNLRFPVTLHTYNQYYLTFYVMETICAFFFMYVMLMFDLIFMSICGAISSQYEVITRALKQFGHDNDKQMGEDNEHLKSFIFDQRRVYMKLKAFNSIVKPIIFIFVAINSSLIVMFSYTFVVIIMSSKLISFLLIFKLGCTVMYSSAQLCIYCSLLDYTNLQRVTVNFGFYSMNWTKMNIKLKKLLLLAMSMNNASCIDLKFSPGKTINLQIFAAVMIKTYNVVSVMINTKMKKRENAEMSDMM